MSTTFVHTEVNNYFNIYSTQAEFLATNVRRNKGKGPSATKVRENAKNRFSIGARPSKEHVQRAAQSVTESSTLFSRSLSKGCH